MLGRPVIGIVVFAAALAARPAAANTWDLNLGRLCRLQTTQTAASVDRRTLDCGGYDRARDGDVTQVLPDNAAFRSLMSELGVLFTPNILAPAETYGYNGFSLAVEFGFTSLNPKNNSTHERLPDGQGGFEPDREHRYWRAAASVSDAAFADGNIQSRDAIDRIERELPPSIAPTISVMARKGLWLPVPSFEIGTGVRHLIDSSMTALVVEGKVALHEGFQGWPLPALAVRGTASHVLGTRDFALTIAGVDVSISKHLGVASTFNLMPYLGYQFLWIIASSDVIDATPGIDAVAESAQASPATPLARSRCQVPDCRANFTFDTQDNILRHRFFIGMRANFYMLSLLLEYSFFAAGRADDTIIEALNVAPASVADESGPQHSVNFALSLDY